MRILIIGLGSIASKHISAIKRIDRYAEIYAYRNSTQSPSNPEVTDIFTLESLDIYFDFIIISNPTILHAKAINSALKFNCPLIIEKPVLGNLEEVALLQKKIDEKNVKTYVACNLRFHPLIIFLKEYLNKKVLVINEINVYCGSHLPKWRPGQEYKKSYSAQAMMGGGVHLDLIHELDYCIWLFGVPIETRVLKRNVSSLEINSIDSATYHFLYKNFTLNIQLNYFRIDTKRQIEILTDSDTLVGDLIANTFTSLTKNEILYDAEFNMSDTYYDQMKYFIKHKNDGMSLMNDFSEGVSTLKIALNEHFKG